MDCIYQHTPWVVFTASPREYHTCVVWVHGSPPWGPHTAGSGTVPYYRYYLEKGMITSSISFNCISYTISWIQWLRCNSAIQFCFVLIVFNFLIMELCVEVMTHVPPSVWLSMINLWEIVDFEIEHIDIHYLIMIWYKFLHNIEIGNHVESGHCAESVRPSRRFRRRYYYSKLTHSSVRYPIKFDLRRCLRAVHNCYEVRLYLLLPSNTLRLAPTSC